MSSLEHSLQHLTCIPEPPRTVRRGQTPLRTAMPVRIAVLAQVKALTDTYNETRAPHTTSMQKEPPHTAAQFAKTPHTAKQHPECALTGEQLWEKVERGIALEKAETRRAFERSKSGTVLPESSECGRARDLVAKKAGFKSFNSYFSAKNVYLNAHNSILELVEKGLLKLTPASEVAKLPYHKQHLIAQLIESITQSNGLSSNLVSYLINNSSLDDEAFLIRLRDRIHNTEIFTRTDIKALIASCARSAKQPVITPIESAVAVQNKKRRGITAELDTIRTMLYGIPITQSVIKRLSDTQAAQTDTLLTHIERLARNLRSHLRIHSPQFSDTETTQTRRYLSAFKESIQYFAHSLPRCKQPIDKQLQDELTRTFRHALSILNTISTKPVLPPRD